MGSLSALEVYWSSPVALAALTSFLLLGIAIALTYRYARARSPTRLRLLRAGTWLVVAFWTFVAASLLLCLLLADPIEYGVATAKVVAVLSISAAVGIASAVAWAISRGVPVQAGNLPRGKWAPGGAEILRLTSRLARESGLPNVRVRTIAGPPLAFVEPPDAVAVSQGLLDLLSGEELEAVLLHELCHLVERDGPEKAFTSAMSRLLFFDPFTRILDRASHREREFRADEWAAKKMGGGAALASALTKLARDTASSRRTPQPERGLGVRHPDIQDRIARLHTSAHGLANYVEVRVHRFRVFGHMTHNLEDSRLRRGERNDGPLAPLHGEADVVPINRRRVLRSVHPEDLQGQPVTLVYHDVARVPSVGFDHGSSGLRLTLIERSLVLHRCHDDRTIRRGWRRSAAKSGSKGKRTENDGEHPKRTQGHENPPRFPLVVHDPPPAHGSDNRPAAKRQEYYGR